MSIRKSPKYHSDGLQQNNYDVSCSRAISNDDYLYYLSTLLSFHLINVGLQAKPSDFPITVCSYNENNPGTC
jgi:hypothetical protein